MFICLVRALLLTYSVRNGISTTLGCMSLLLTCTVVGFQGCTVDEECSVCSVEIAMKCPI